MPASASRGRRRQSRKADPPASAKAASNQGKNEKPRSGASGAAGLGGSEGETKPGCGTGAGAVWAGAAKLEAVERCVAAGWALAVCVTGPGPGVVVCCSLCAARRAAGGVRALTSLGTGLDGGAAAGGEGLTASGAGAGSLGLVTLPDKLKFCSSLGPTASDGAVLDDAGGDCGVACASALAGASPKTPASKTATPRKIALIAPALRESPHHFPAASTGQMPATCHSFKHLADERSRNLVQRASTSTSSASSSASISRLFSPVIATPSRGSASTPFTRTRPLGTR